MRIYAALSLMLHMPLTNVLAKSFNQLLFLGRTSPITALPIN